MERPSVACVLTWLDLDHHLRGLCLARSRRVPLPPKYPVSSCEEGNKRSKVPEIKVNHAPRRGAHWKPMGNFKQGALSNQRQCVLWSI